MSTKKIMTADVVVIGGGPGGIASAVAAAREGVKVILVERQGFLGGNLASGLPFLATLDNHQRRIVGGLSEQFIQDLKVKEYGSVGHKYCPFHISTTNINPHLAKIICFEWTKKYDIQLLMHCEISDVNVDNGKLKSITVTGKGQEIKVQGKVFIDGTGDGDVGYMAGAEWEKGQAETGIIQPPSLLFNLAGIDFDRFSDYIEQHPEDLPYNHGLNHIKEGYNSDFFRNNSGHIFFGFNATIDRLRAMGECPIDRESIIYIKLPTPNEVMVNTIRILNVDGSKIEDLSRAEQEAHLQILPIIDMLKKHLPGFENAYLSSINPVIGVRESRRIMGIKKLTKEDAIASVVPDDTIGLNTYLIDIHNGSGEGTYTKIIEEPYGIPYGCTVSKDIDGLMMTGRCISVDAVTFGSTRIMPICMEVGEAAGIGAAISIKKGIAPKDVDPQEVRKILLDNGAILTIDQAIEIAKVEKYSKETK